MEATASAITLLDFALRMYDFGCAVKESPELWQQYKDNLRVVACLQIALNTTIDNHPRIRDLILEGSESTEEGGKPISEGGKTPKNFVDFVSTRVERVQKDAEALLTRFDLAANQKPNINLFRRVIRKIRRVPKVCGFLLSSEQIKGMIRDVEHAQKQLQMALTLASLNTSVSWQNETGALLATIKHDMVKYGETLEKIEANSRLRLAVLELDPQTVILQPTVSGNHTSRGRTSLSDPAGSKKGSKRKKQKKSNARGGLFAAVRSRFTPRHAQGSQDLMPLPPPQDATRGDDGPDNAKDGQQAEGTITPEPLSISTPTQDLGAPVLDAVQYDLLMTPDGRVLQVPIDSEAYASAAGHHLNEDINVYFPPPTAVPATKAVESTPDDGGQGDAENIAASHPQTAVSATEIIESTPDKAGKCDNKNADVGHLETPIPAADSVEPAPGEDEDKDKEWDEKSSCCNEEIDFMSSASSIAHPTTTEEVTTKPLFSINTQFPMYISVAECVTLGRCSPSGGTKLRFCVHDTCINHDDQVLSALEPCSVEEDSQCNHVTLEIEWSLVAAMSLPFKMELAFLRQETESSADTDTNTNDKNVTSPGAVRASLPSAGFCYQGQCGHTKLVAREDSHSAQCAVPVKLHAHLVHRYFPVEPDPEDDLPAFGLLQRIMLDKAAQIPSEIQWDSFVRFLVLAHKYAEFVDNKPLQQARCWVQQFESSSLLDSSAFIWLWVTWKLQMGPEFKRLSSIVLQETRSPVSQWQDAPENKFHVRLPEAAVEVLDRRRAKALSRVACMLAAELERCRKDYPKIAARDRADLLASSLPSTPSLFYRLIFGGPTLAGSLLEKLQKHDKSVAFALDFLTWKGDKWLEQYGPASADYKFLGVSVADVTRAARWLPQPWLWKASADSDTQGTANFLTGFSPFAAFLDHVESPGKGTAKEGTQQGWGEKFHQLIEEIEREDWGVSLAEISLCSV